jgi:hypothetical protein
MKSLSGADAKFGPKGVVRFERGKISIVASPSTPLYCSRHSRLNFFESQRLGDYRESVDVPDSDFSSIDPSLAFNLQ